MQVDISSLLHERQLIKSRLEKMIYGSIEVRNSNNKQYIYVHRRYEGIRETKYAGEYSNELYTMIVENNNLAKEYKKRLKQINKQLDSINYIESELSEETGINVAFARRNLTNSIYKQSILEGIATTYLDTETIINGGKVKNMTVFDISKVINLKRSWDFILANGVITYPTNFNILCQINSIIEEGFSIMAGKLRTLPVTIGGSSYIPPMPLESVVKEELIEIVNSSDEIIDKAITLLLYVMKKQLFLDGNKRTAVLFANHYLISQGGGLLVIPDFKVEEFKKMLISYYKDNDDENIKTFLKKECWQKI